MRTPSDPRPDGESTHDAGLRSAATRGGRLVVDGHELAWGSTAGHVDGPAFVLVPGLGMSHRYLERLAQELRRTGTTSWFDMPGFGDSPTPSDPMSVAAGAELLGAAIDALGLGPAVLVGHSMGAQLVTELAAQRPELVTHLVLVGPVTDPRRARRLVQARDLVRDALREPLTGNALTFVDYLRCGPRWYQTELTQMLAYRTDERLRDVAAPTLVVRGASDPIARRPWCVDLAAAAQVGSLVEIAGHRHLVQYSAATATAAAVVELLASVPATGA